MDFHLKYILPQSVSNEGKVKLVILHPTEKILGLGINDSGYFLDLWEYEYSSILDKQAKIIKEAGVTGPEQKNMKFPTFKLLQSLQKEKIDAFNNITFNSNGKQVYIIFNKSIKIFSFIRSRTPVLKLDNYIEHPYEIISFAASNDNKTFAFGTLDGKIVIYESNKTYHNWVFECENKIVSQVWDPLGRFQCCLTLDNTVCIFNMLTKIKEKQIELFSKDDKNLNRTISKEERKIDFSPDLRYILAPSLYDRRMPHICAQDREKGFDIVSVMGGSFVPITCIKFMPCIFNRQGKIFTIFALGDAYGNISIWEFGEGSQRDSPLCLLKADDYNMTIDNIEFDSNGEFLIASTDRKFFVLCTFADHSDLFSYKINKGEYNLSKYGKTNTYNEESFKTYKDFILDSENNQNSVNATKFDSSTINNDLDAQKNTNDDKKQEDQVPKPKKIILYKKGKKVDIAIKDDKPEQKPNNLNPQQNNLSDPNNKLKSLADTSNSNDVKKNKASQIVNELDSLKQNHKKDLNTSYNSIEEVMTSFLPNDSNSLMPKKDDQANSFEGIDKAFNHMFSNTNSSNQNFFGSNNQEAKNQVKKAEVFSKKVKLNQDQANAASKQIDNDIFEKKLNLEYFSRMTKQATEGVFHISSAGNNSNSNELQASNQTFYCLKYKRKIDDRVSTKQSHIIEKSTQNESGNTEQDTKIKAESYLTTLEMTNFKFSEQAMNGINNSTTLWATSLEGSLIAVEWNSDCIALYTDKLAVYLLKLSNGKREELPLYVGHQHTFKISKDKCLMVLKTNGDLLVFDIANQKQKVNSSVLALVRDHFKIPNYLVTSLKFTSSEENLCIYKNYETFSLFLSKNSVPVIQLDLQTYMMYNPTFNSWSLVDLEYVFEDIVTFSDQKNIESDVNKKIRSQENQIHSHLRDMANESQKDFEPIPFLHVSNNENNQIFGNSNQSETIYELEEKMLLCMKNTKDSENKSKWGNYLKSYIIELAKHRQYIKLEDFLQNTLLKDDNSTERKYLKEININYKVILNNAQKILQEFKENKELLNLTSTLNQQIKI